MSCVTVVVWSSRKDYLRKSKVLALSAVSYGCKPASPNRFVSRYGVLSTQLPAAYSERGTRERKSWQVSKGRGQGQFATGGWCHNDALYLVTLSAVDNVTG